MFDYRLTSEHWDGLFVLWHEEKLLITYSPPVLERFLFSGLSLLGSAVVFQYAFFGFEFIPGAIARVLRDFHILFRYEFWVVIFFCVFGLPLGIYLLHLALAGFCGIHVIEASDDFYITRYPIKIHTQRMSPAEIVRFDYTKPGLMAKSRAHPFSLLTTKRKRIRLFSVYDEDDADEIHLALNQWLLAHKRASG